MRISNVLANMGKHLKSFRWIQRCNFLRSPLRTAGVLISKSIFLNGVRKNIGGIDDFVMHPEFIFCNYENWGGAHNNGFHKFVHLAKDKKCVFDIGAHIGLCSLPISRVLAKDGVCYAFEPAYENLKYLKLHLKLNHIKNVIIVPYLVGDRCSEAVDFFCDEKCSGMNSICHRKSTEGAFKQIKTKQLTLDNFVRETNSIPQVIKIDVEGAEINVLSGAKKTLKKYHPEIILSVHPTHLKLLGYSADDLLDLISELNYRIYDIDGGQIQGLQFQEYYLR